MNTMNHNPGVRGIGGILVGAAMGLIAEHLDMPRWEVIAIAALVGIGLPMAISGRWKDW
jgi:hypothetical protein